MALCVDAIDLEEGAQGNVAAAKEDKVDVVEALAGHLAGHGGDSRHAAQAGGGKHDVAVQGLAAVGAANGLDGAAEVGQLDGAIVVAHLLRFRGGSASSSGSLTTACRGRRRRRRRGSISGRRRSSWWWRWCCCWRLVLLLLRIGIWTRTGGYARGRDDAGQGDDEQDSRGEVGEQTEDGAPARGARGRRRLPVRAVGVAGA